MIELEVVEGAPYVLLPRVMARDLDLAVVFTHTGLPTSIDFEGRPSTADETLTRHRLFDDPLKIVVPAITGWRSGAKCGWRICATRSWCRCRP